MTPEQKENFRLAILRVLDANRTRYGLGITAIAHAIRAFAWSAANFGGDLKAFHDAIADALQYLGDKGFVEEALKMMSKDNRAWRITDKGIGYLDERA